MVDHTEDYLSCSLERYEISSSLLFLSFLSFFLSLSFSCLSFPFPFPTLSLSLSLSFSLFLSFSLHFVFKKPVQIQSLLARGFQHQLQLNKTDLFREKIVRVDTQSCFPEYTGIFFFFSFLFFSFSFIYYKKNN
jgi:hypothetical protein